ncbi:MAG: DUF4335 domain-containing protein [Cyanobacteria bacterium P01_A01_bin.135]
MDAIRRYSPPTCTLELRAKTSPLARWTLRPVLKGVTFRLSFDSPQRPQDDHLQVSGVQEQLTAIAASVQDYVQQMLGRSPQQFAPQLQSVSQAASSEEPGAIVSNSQNSQHPAQTTGNPAPVAVLQPLPSLQHRLQLTLAPRPTVAIALSTLELLDLADALAAYGKDGVVALPAAPPRPWVGPAVAAVLVAGLTGTLVPLLLSQSRQPEVAESQAVDSASDAPAELDSAEAPVVAKADDPPPSLPELTLPLPSDPTAPAPAPLESAPPVSAPPAPSQRSAAVPRADNSAGGPPVNPQRPAPAARSSSSLPEAAPVAPIPRTAAGEATPNLPAELPAELRSIPPLEEPAPPPSRQERQLSAAQPPGAPSTTGPNQVARQVQARLQERWQPPGDLQQSLEYRVTVAPDGTLQRVTPIGDTARAYLPQITVLQIGEAIGSPTGTASPSIRLVLRQDGQVLTFVEQP